MRGLKCDAYGYTLKDISLHDSAWLHYYIYSNPEITMWNSYMPHEKEIQSWWSTVRNYFATKFSKTMYYIVYYDRKPVGVLCLREMSKTTLVISYNVAAEYQNKGHGTHMVQMACDIAKSLGYGFVFAVILPMNAASMHICKKNGFEITQLNFKYGAVKRLKS